MKDNQNHQRNRITCFTCTTIFMHSVINFKILLSQVERYLIHITLDFIQQISPDDFYSFITVPYVLRGETYIVLSYVLLSRWLFSLILFYSINLFLSFYILRFSFEITRRGEILKVYHPPDDSEVLAIKKGFAAIFSSKLHSKEEVHIHVFHATKHKWIRGSYQSYSENIKFLYISLRNWTKSEARISS